MSRNQKVLESFVAYCKAHPTDRFWQALRNWSSYNFILVSNKSPWDEGTGMSDFTDTYYWEGKDK